MSDATFHFQVNGEPRTVRSDPKTSLGMVLRNELGLRGTRMGCEEAQCGACTVTLDGRAVQSCDIAIEMVTGKDVVTIEGLVESDPPHALVEAILDVDAGQCGFCIAGIIMSALPLYGQTRDRADLLDALDRNLCRCAAHSRILQAVESALSDAPA